MITDSPLGLSLLNADLLDGLRFQSANGPALVEESYSLPHGKRQQRFNAANALTLRFRKGQGAFLELDLRAYDDGVAFRYRITGAAGVARTLTREWTGFRLPLDAHCGCNLLTSSRYSPAYETYYENGAPVGTVSTNGAGWALPLLFCTADERHWGLVTEANLGSNYFGARLMSSATNGLYRVRMPEPDEGRGYGATDPVSLLPWEMPWRVIILGDWPGTIVESTLVEDLSAPAKPGNWDWAGRGRVAWSWWSDGRIPRMAAPKNIS